MAPRLICLLAALAAAVLLEVGLAGCQLRSAPPGPAVDRPAATAAFGTIDLTVRWPERTTAGRAAQAIPATADRIGVSVAGTGDPVGTVLATASVERTDATTTTATASLRVPAGTVSVSAKAYKDAELLAWAGPLTVAIVGGARVSAKLTFDRPPIMLAAVSPAIGNTGDTIYLEGAFGETATVNFPGGAKVAATVLGPYRAKAVVPAEATAGDLTVTSDGQITRAVSFRRASFGLGLQSFARHYDQASYARSAPALASARSNYCLASTGTYLYAIGGVGAGNTVLGSVERATINADGTLGAFKALADRSLATARFSAACVAVGSSLYLVGGADVSGRLASVEQASIGSDGTLGTFSPASGVALAGKRAGHTAHVIGRYLYVWGGEGPTGDLRGGERARIWGDGSLGKFEPVDGVAFRRVRRGHAAAAAGKYLYVFGGYDGGMLSSGERAPIAPDGTLGAFEDLPGSFGKARMAIKAVVAGAALYLVGGGDANPGLPDVDRASVDADGNLGSFSAGPALPTGRSDHQVTIVGNYLYALGGNVQGGAKTANVQWVSLNGTGGLGAFQTMATPTLAKARQFHGWVVSGNRLYLAGGRTAEALVDSVESAQADAVGMPGAFGEETGTRLGRARENFSMAAIGDMVYLVGGTANNDSFSTLEEATVGADGKIGAFTGVDPQTSQLETEGLAHFSAAIGGYLYVFGGHRQPEGVDLARVERAAIVGSALGTFAETPGVSLRNARHAHCGAVLGDYVYVIGGTVANSAAVERAAIGADGTLGNFETYGTGLNTSRVYAHCFVLGPYLYVGGNELTRDFERARIGADGALGSFERINTSQTSEERGKGAPFLLGDFVYLVGGATKDRSARLGTLDRAILN